MRTMNENAPFQRIPDACRSTGLSQYFLRRGCRDGTVPHIRRGRVYWINIPALIEKFGAEGVPRD